MSRPVHEWLLAATAALVVAGITAWWSMPAEGGDALMVAQPTQSAAMRANAVTLGPVAAGAHAADPTLSAADRWSPSAVRQPWPELSAGALVAWGRRAEGVRTPVTPVFRPPSVAASAPPPPAPPPLAWRYVGRIVEAGTVRAILVHASQGTAVVGVSDMVDGQWRVERVREDAVELIWLPDGVRRQLVAPA